MSITSTATIFLLLAVAATTTFCHQELETSENFRTQTDQASEALAFNVKPGKPNGKLLTSWNPAYSKADYVVAQDGSGTHKTINDALDALVRTGGDRRNRRVIVYVKAGEYNERVVIKKNMEKLMFVGDGMDRTIVIGNRNAKRDGFAPHETATFGVYADGFWARDMTFENTAGPDGHQVVALMMRSEQSVVYRCSVKNVIVSQGRKNPDENTGVSIQGSRIRAAPGFDGVRNIPTFLGRQWKKYSRIVIFETDIDGLIDPAGWLPWDGSVYLNTFYAEYNNTGCGASTEHRVEWPGFHVLKKLKEAGPFTVKEAAHKREVMDFSDRRVLQVESLNAFPLVLVISVFYPLASKVSYKINFILVASKKIAVNKPPSLLIRNSMRKKLNNRLVTANGH
ncbi:hypothetical protein OIU76_023143 [Salix suchowensis]|uniref:Pectinesterase catalytic domain-containing protein n=1 Tax=Salix suchowensis TaxID=1278906 RepID=A0ABQ9AJM6_9ROSI|nr:hypothetical protein OIU76_023143 [Salix suchowensis]KAJ6340279.1 hypothetical protein OIU77_008105 [Salix suchowensis]